MKILAIALSVSLASAVLTAPAPPVVKPPPRQMLVVSNHAGNYEVYLVNPDSGDARNLTNHKYADTDPSWSGDGSRIVFVSNRTGSEHLYTMNPDAGDVRQVTTGKETCSCPRFSPDGKKIVYASVKDGRGQVFITDADGKNARALTTDRTASGQPEWSPDGRRICFTRYGPAAHETYLMDADGGNQVNLTATEGGIDSSFSPDGKWIAFASERRKGGFRTYVMGTQGGNAQQLNATGNDWGYVLPSWSPDSKQVAFTDWVGASAQISIANADGKNLKTLTRGGNCYSAKWSPDGKTIAYIKNAENQPPTLWIMSLDGMQQREVMREVLTCTWRPATPRK